MKNIFLSALSCLTVFSGSLIATPTKCDLDGAPIYNNRIVALQSGLVYERSAKDSIHLGFESFVTSAIRGKNDSTTIGVVEARIGHSFTLTEGSSITPVVGASMLRDLEEGKSYIQKKGGVTIETTFREPYFFHGTIGFMADYAFSNSFDLGLTAKALIGTSWGANVDKVEDLSYGFHGSLPITFRFGTGYHWDFRLEPYALLLKDYNNYVGLKAGVGYRF
jgi:hypothetical protein